MGRLINLISYKRPLLAFGVPGGILFLATDHRVFRVCRLLNNFEIPVCYVNDQHACFSARVLLVIAGLMMNTLVMIVKESK
jgi:hypothetical protein